MEAAMSIGSRVTRKGQITIPKPVRDRLGLRPGDEVEFVEDVTGVRLRRRIGASPFAAYRGHLDEQRGVDPDRLVDELRGPVDGERA
jgi:AbrB family looped-hinge helix DNA binding protein